MNPSETMPVVQALGWTLIHFLWQGAAAALLLVVINTALKNCSANLRYLSSCAALLMMLALPLITFAALRSDLAATTVLTSGPDAQIGAGSLPGGERKPATALASPPWEAREMFPRFAPWLTSLWLAGVAVLSLKMLGGWLFARRLKDYTAGPLPDEWQRRVAELCRKVRVLRPVRILKSALVETPAVIGWMRPVVLIPVSALLGLTPRQLEAVIAHELAHIRRYDYLVNLLQTAVEILLFYHPAVWWVSREIRQEREHCCDDVAVAVCGDALVYARALTEIEALRCSTPQLAMAAGGGSLLARIHRIVGGSPQRPEQRASWLAGVMVLVFVVGAGAQIFSGRTRASEPAGFGATPPAAMSSAPATEPQRAAPRADSPSDKRGTKSETSKGAGSQGESSTDQATAAGTQQSQGNGSFIKEIVALGYTGLSVDDFIALKNYGVTPQFIRELKAQGYDKLSIEQLKRLASMGVTVQFIKEVKAAGIEQLPVESLIRLQTHGVTPAFMKELGSLGYKNLSPDQLTNVASHGVTPEFIRALQSAGYKDVAIADVVRAHDHGVSPVFIKEIHDLKRAGIPLNELIRMKDHGVDAEFIRSMESAGFGHLEVDEIIRARDHGADPEFVRKIRSAGYPDATLGQLIQAKDRGLTPDDIESVKKAGYTNVPMDLLIRMRDHGVDAGFIQRAKSHGFQNLSIEQLIRLRDAGVIN
jgi:beta-lactamase regulating signal transducer with metallopeptidase domain